MQYEYKVRTHGLVDPSDLRNVQLEVSEKLHAHCGGSEPVCVLTTDPQESASRHSSAGAAVPCIVPCNYCSGIRARPCPDGRGGSLRGPGRGRAGAAVPRLFGASRAVPRGASEVATTSTPHTPHRVRPCVRTPAWRPKSKFGFSYESHKYHYRARLGHIILRTRRVSGALH